MFCYLVLFSLGRQEVVRFGQLFIFAFPKSFPFRKIEIVCKGIKNIRYCKPFLRKIFQKNSKTFFGIADKRRFFLNRLLVSQKFAIFAGTNDNIRTKGQAPHV